MDHVAFMKKSWGFLEKIIKGEKTIESRWYLSRRAPWNKVEIGDRIFFKNSGEPITVKAKVDKVLQFADLNPAQVKSLLLKYGRRLGLEPQNINFYYKLFKDKKCCILVFLKDAKKVNPFNLDKKGYGMMSAWISVENIVKINTDEKIRHS